MDNWNYDLENRRVVCLQNQKNSGYNRSLVINYMIDIKYNVNLSTHVLCVAINYFDRILHRTKVDNLFTLASTCIIIAVKNEICDMDIFLKELYEYKIRTKDFVKYERKVLYHLDYELLTPTSTEFMYTIIHMNNLNENIFLFCNFLLGRYMYEETFPYHMPSIIATAITVLGCKAYNYDETKILKTTNYRLPDIYNALVQIYEMHVSVVSNIQDEVKKNVIVEVYHKSHPKIILNIPHLQFG